MKEEIIEEYKKSLKVIDVDEIVDIIFFRPIAFAFTKLIYKTNITPNQVSFLSMIFGILAGFCISLRTNETVLAGGIALIISAILDCADGQLARLKHNGTFLGRFLDGGIDYISSISVFIGIGIWGANLWLNPTLWWFVVVFTGITYAIQAGMVDYYRNEFLFNSKGQSNFIANELKNFQKEIDKLIAQKRGWFVRSLLNLYILYSKIQGNLIKVKNKKYSSPEEYIKKNKLPMWLWNINGSSTHAFILLICSIFNRLDIFIWYALLFGNIWTILVWIIQKRVDYISSKEYKSILAENNNSEVLKH